jgi:hypothetical protein
VQSLKLLASSMLPELQRRTTLATQAAASVGADVTASGSEGGQGASGN